MALNKQVRFRGLRVFGALFLFCGLVVGGTAFGMSDAELSSIKALHAKCMARYESADRRAQARLRPTPQSNELAGRMQATPGRYQKILFRNLGMNENLVLADDPKLDPVFHDWLRATRTATAKIADPVERARTISDALFKRFDKEIEISPLTRALRYVQRWARGGRAEVIPIGDLLGKREHEANCRAKSTLLIAALRDAGYTAELMTGIMEIHKQTAKGTERVGEEFHAWVRLRQPDGTWIHLDPVMESPARPTALRFRDDGSVVGYEVPALEYHGEKHVLVYRPFPAPPAVERILPAEAPWLWANGRSSP